MPNETVAITFKMPASMREKMEALARAEERTLASFLRYHLAKIIEEQTAALEANEPALP